MKDEILYQILRTIFILIGLIPKPISHFMANALGRIWYDLDARHRAIALNNIEKALGDDLTQREQQHLTKRVFQNIALMLFELGWAMHLKTRDLPRHFSLKGLDNLQKACSKGKGALLLLCHIGNWELLVGGIALTGFRSSAIYRKLDFLPLDRLIRELREKHGTRMIPLRGPAENWMPCWLPARWWERFWIKMWTGTRGSSSIFSVVPPAPTVAWLSSL